MNAKLSRRLDLLERNTQGNRATAEEAITAAALTALSDEDLERLRQVAERSSPSVDTGRGGRSGPVSG